MLVSPSRPLPSRAARVVVLGAALAALGVSAAPAAAVPGSHGPESVRESDVVDAPVPGGPTALVAWTDGRRVRVSAPGSPARTVARLTTARPDGADLSLSRDGRHLVVLADSGAFDLPIAAGGRPTRLGDPVGQGAAGVRWSPDSRRLLLVQGDVVRCVVEPTATCGPTAAKAAVSEFGASWSPDGSRFAYIRHRSSKTVQDTELGDLVIVPATGTGPTQVVERAVLGATRRTYPVPPVWTRAGLAFSVYAERAVRVSDDGISRVVGPTRVRTRILGPDGRVRTLTASAPGRDERLPFLAASDSPSGRLLGLRVGHERRGSRGAWRVDFDLRTLGSDGGIAPYGVGFTATDGSEPDIVGVLADGRVALRTTRDDRARTATLQLLTPGGAPATVARGGAVSAAVAYPNDALGF